MYGHLLFVWLDTFNFVLLSIRPSFIYNFVITTTDGMTRIARLSKDVQPPLKLCLIGLLGPFISNFRVNQYSDGYNDRF